MKDLNGNCHECGMHVGPGDVYHPYLYCELFKLGHRDPAAYLRGYGFERVPDLEREGRAISAFVKATKRPRRRETVTAK